MSKIILCLFILIGACSDCDGVEVESHYPSDYDAQIYDAATCD